MHSSATLHDLIDRQLRQHEAELIELHRGLVRVPTVNNGDGSSAGEDKAAAFLATWLGERGMVSQTLADGDHPTRANLIAECGGGAAKRTLLFMSHSDVVPVGDVNAWTHPPFSGELAGGRIWGRGANDCKMLAAAQTFVLRELQRAGLPAGGRVRLIVGADEEAGGEHGFGWLAKAHPELVRADLAICEGGGSSLGRLGGDVPLISVGSGEKGRFDISFVCRAEGGHAAAPWGRVNPLAELGKLLARIAEWQPEAYPASPVFGYLGGAIGIAEGIVKANLAEAIGKIDALAPALGRSLRAQSRMTLTPTILHGGEGSNVIPSEARLICDSRLLPGQMREALESVVRGLAEGIAGLEIEIKQNAPASRCELDEGLRLMFEGAAARAIGEGVKAVPTWCTGATDAHWVRAVGTPVYGFQFIDPAADATRLGIHCVDESIEAGMLLPCALSLAHFAVDFLAE